MIKYNTEFLVRVKVNPFHQSKWYEYRKKRKSFGFTIQDEGFYSRSICGFDYMEVQELPKNHTMIDGIIYENPECVLYYVDGSSKTYSFNSVQEAIDFSNKFTIGGKWHE